MGWQDMRAIILPGELCCNTCAPSCQIVEGNRLEKKGINALSCGRFALIT